MLKERKAMTNEEVTSLSKDIIAKIKKIPI